MARMSALGQKRTFAPQKAMSALPPKADVGVTSAISEHPHSLSEMS
jgi:hypothetical protein